MDKSEKKRLLKKFKENEKKQLKSKSTYIEKTTYGYESTINDLELEIKLEKRKDYNSHFTGASLLNVCILSLAFDRFSEFDKWFPITKKYLNEYDLNKDPDPDNANEIYYQKYVAGIFDNNVDDNLIEKYADELRNYYLDMPLNKSNLTFLEEYLLYLVIANKNEEAGKLAKRILSIQKRKFAELINCFLSGDRSINGDKKKYLNQNRKRLTVPFSLGFAYFFFYYSFLFNDFNINDLCKSLVHGIN